MNTCVFIAMFEEYGEYASISQYGAGSDTGGVLSKTAGPRVALHASIQPIVVLN